MIEVGSNAYGKSAIRLVKVVRDETHRVRDLTIAIALAGDFAASYTDGDNSAVIATDTMKNTCYALAGEHLYPGAAKESYAGQSALSVATILVSIYAVYHAGWGNIVAKISSTMGSAGFDPIQNPKFGITFLIWQVLLWFSIHTCWQTTAMRVFSTRTPEISKRVMTWTGFIYLGRGMLPMLWGAAALTLFGVGVADNGVPLPVVNGQTLAPIDAMPAMLPQTTRIARARPVRTGARG